jgi:hypothetical protein
VSGLALTAGLSLLWGRRHGSRVAGRRTAALAAAFGLAAASPVVVLRHGLAVALVLVALVAAYDASVYIVGTGASAAWEGPAAGVAAVLSLTLGVAGVLVPPFRGPSPWILGGLTAALAPAGVVAVSRLVADPHAPVQGARRLDSLLLVGPVWAVLAAPLLGR